MGNNINYNKRFAGRELNFSVEIISWPFIVGENVLRDNETQI